jgi:hypothetical protein
MWSTKFPALSGLFPAGHPAAPSSPAFGRPECQCGTSPALERFRGLGYWASCFPEGDGLTLMPLREQDAAQVSTDLRVCFGWDVVVRRR